MSQPQSSEQKQHHLYSVVTIFWKGQMFGFSLSNWTKQQVADRIHTETLCKFKDYFVKSHMENQLNDKKYVFPNGPNNCVSISKQEIKEIETDIDDFVREFRYFYKSSYVFKSEKSLEIFCKMYLLSRFVNSKILIDDCNFFALPELLIDEYQIQYVCQGCERISIDKMKKCGDCKSKSVYFCSKECQKQNWLKHKYQCEGYSKIHE